MYGVWVPAAGPISSQTTRTYNEIANCSRPDFAVLPNVRQPADLPTQEPLDDASTDRQFTVRWFVFIHRQTESVWHDAGSICWQDDRDAGHDFPGNEGSRDWIDGSWSLHIHSGRKEEFVDQEADASALAPIHCVTQWQTFQSFVRPDHWLPDVERLDQSSCHLQDNVLILLIACDLHGMNTCFTWSCFRSTSIILLSQNISSQTVFGDCYRSIMLNECERMMSKDDAENGQGWRFLFQDLFKWLQLQKR